MNVYFYKMVGSLHTIKPSNAIVQMLVLLCELFINIRI